jgi:MFS superfamily sulfate permease-like transporter
MEYVETLVFGIMLGMALSVILAVLAYSFLTMNGKKKKNENVPSQEFENEAIPEVIFLFEQKVSTVISIDRYINREEWDKAVIDLEKYFISIVKRAEYAEGMIEYMIAVANPLWIALLAINDKPVDKENVKTWLALVEEWKNNA